MNKNNSLTQKQHQVYVSIKDYVTKENKSPTVSELARLMNVSSLRTVTQYLESLEKKGLISRIRHRRRGIRLLDSVENETKTVTLPVISSAGCDNVNVCADIIYDEHITVDKNFLKGKTEVDVVLIRAVGKSMIDGGIDDNDLVLTEMTENVSDGERVVVILDGMAVIKKIHFSENAIILNPMTSNSIYTPIIMKGDFKVFGKVIDVIKTPKNNSELTYEYCNYDKDASENCGEAITNYK